MLAKGDYVSVDFTETNARYDVVELQVLSVHDDTIRLQDASRVVEVSWDLVLFCEYCDVDYYFHENDETWFCPVCETVSTYG